VSLPTLASFTWSTRRDGNAGFVLERCEGTQWIKEFGPMPAHITLAFVESRRRLIAMNMEAEGFSQKLTEY